MNKLLTLLCAAALVTSAMAQDAREADSKLPPGAIPLDKLPPGAIPVDKLPPGAIPVDKLPPGAIPVDKLPPGAVPAPGDPRSQPWLKKVCVPEPSTTRTTRTYYDCKCKDYCLPKCPFRFCFWKKQDCCDQCGPAGCARCEKQPRTRNVLIKKVATEECPSFKCVPKTVVAPPCCQPCAPDGCAPAPAAEPGALKGPEPIGPPREEGPAKEKEPTE